jgi:ACT domain-containing protein
VKDADLRRLVAEVTREVTAQTERGGRSAPAAGDARRGGRAVVTTTGKNQRGIVARIAQAIADAGGDIVDISQTLVSDYFTMIIIVDTGALSVSFAEFKTRLERTVAAAGAECLVMHEDVVNALQRV